MRAGRVGIIGVWLLLTSVFYSAALEDSAGIGDPYYPTLGNPGYDVLSYQLELHVPLSPTTVEASALIRAVAGQETMARFQLDFNGPAITELLLDGEPVAFTRDSGELKITPPTPIAAGAEFEVVVRYAGQLRRPRNSYEGGMFGAGWWQFPRGVVVANQTDGASYWFPTSDHPSDKALYVLDITVPTGYVVAANGVLRETRDEGDWVSYVWGSDYPVASYLVQVAIGDFTRQDSQSDGGVPIRNYLPARLADRLETTLARQGAMLDFYGDLIAPYPFEAYGVVVADTNFGFALETQTLSLFPASLRQADRTHGDNLLAHEMVHQWFGDSLSIASWQDIWLNEGFAMYFAALWQQHTEGDEAFQATMHDYYRVAVEWAQRGAAPIGDPGREQLFATPVYLRGACALHALRLALGDDAFFTAIRAYYQQYQYGNASIADFIASVEATSGRDLTAFFQGWLYDVAVPVADF